MGDGHSLVTWGREEHCTEGNLGNNALYPGLVPAECRLTNCFCLGKENKLCSELLGSKAGCATGIHVPHHPPSCSQPTQHSAFRSVSSRDGKRGAKAHQGSQCFLPSSPQVPPLLSSAPSHLSLSVPQAIQQYSAGSSQSPHGGQLRRAGTTQWHKGRWQRGRVLARQEMRYSQQRRDGGDEGMDRVEHNRSKTPSVQQMP